MQTMQSVPVRQSVPVMQTVKRYLFLKLFVLVIFMVVSCKGKIAGLIENPDDPYVTSEVSDNKSTNIDQISSDSSLPHLASNCLEEQILVNNLNTSHFANLILTYPNQGAIIVARFQGAKDTAVNIFVECDGGFRKVAEANVDSSGTLKYSLDPSLYSSEKIKQKIWLQLAADESTISTYLSIIEKPKDTPGVVKHMGENAYYYESAIFPVVPSINKKAVNLVNHTNRIYYVKMESQPSHQKYDACILQHGYGISEKSVEMNTDYDNNFADAAGRLGGYGHSFWPDVFTSPLASKVCKTIYVTLQNTVEATTLEGAMKLELFLRDVVCNHVTNCMVFGQSKGGAMATTVARRCMQEISLAGAAACQKIGHIYSASGVPLGAAASFMMIGSDATTSKTMFRSLGEFIGFFAKYVADTMVNTPTSGYMGERDYVPGKNNPVWVDLGPSAPFENKIPGALVNNVILEKTGWLNAWYSAHGANNIFTGDLMELDFKGCAEWVASDAMKSNCRSFEATIRIIHGKLTDGISAKGVYTAGVNAIKANPLFANPFTNDSKYLDDWTWDVYQESDGLADSFTALTVCRRGGSATGSCTESGLCHFATTGGSQIFINAAISQLLK